MTTTEITPSVDLVDVARAKIAEAAAIEARLGKSWADYDRAAAVFCNARPRERRALIARIDQAMTPEWSVDERPHKRFSRFCRLSPRLVAEAETGRVSDGGPLNVEAVLLRQTVADTAAMYRLLDREVRRELARRINAALGFEWSPDLDPPERFARFVTLPRRLRAEALTIDFPKPVRSGRIARRLAYDRTVARF